MSVDTQVSTETPEHVKVELEMGRPCYLPARAALGVLMAVEPGDTVTVALHAGVIVPAAADDVVLLPQVGEFVELPRDSGLLRGYWVGLVPPSGAEGPVTARVVAGAEVVEHVTDPQSLRASRTLSGPVDPGVSSVVQAVARSYELLDGARRQHEAWREQLNEAACDRADDQGWCSDFDAFMNDWGMSGRRRTYDVEVEVTGRVTIRVEAARSSDAEEAVTRAQVVEAAGERLADLDYEVKDAEQA